MSPPRQSHVKQYSVVLLMTLLVFMYAAINPVEFPLKGPMNHNGHLVNLSWGSWVENAVTNPVFRHTLIHGHNHYLTHFLVVVAGALLLSLNIVVVLRYSRTFALLRAYALVAKHFIKTARLYAKESKTWSPPAVTTQASVATDAVCFTAQLFLDMRSVANMALGVPPTPKPVGEISQPGALTPLLIFQKLYSKQETPPQFFITSTSTGGSKMSDAEDEDIYRPRVAQSIAEPPPTTLSPVETHDANEWDDDGAITESYGTEAGEESTTDESLETLGRDEYEKHIHSMGTHEQTDEHSES